MMKRKLSSLQDCEQQQSASAEDIITDRQLQKELVHRYSRQMLIPQININGQLAITLSSVIIIGG
jgi:glutaredoxin-related protein